MAKKQKQTTNDNVEVIVPDEEKATKQPDNKKVKNSAKVEDSNKSDKNAKTSKQKVKTKKERKSLKKKASEVWSELKKVSKPSFGKVVKNTCIVISVVAICTILLLGVDKLFELIYQLLIPNS